MENYKKVKIERLGLKNRFPSFFHNNSIFNKEGRKKGYLIILSWMKN